MTSAPLAELTRLISSGATPLGGAANYAPVGDVMLIRSQNVLMGRLSLDDVAFITRDAAEKMSRTYLKQGDVLLNITGASIGRVAPFELDVIANVNQHVCVIRPRQDLLDHRYLSAFLASPFMQQHIDGQQHGGTRQALTFSQIGAFTVPLPSLPEQRRIADILDKADAIRGKRKQAIVLTEELLRSAFLEMFGDPVTNPKGWPITTLGEEASQMKYGTSEKCGPESPGALPVLRIPNIVGGEISWSDLKYATLAPPETDRLRLRNGDLLFVRTNGNPDYIGRCAVYESNRAALFASYLIRVRLDGRQLRPTYVRSALSSSSYRARLTAEARTTAGNYNISTEGLRRLELPVPPMDAQVRFSNFEAGVRRSFERLNIADSDVEKLFAGLVQRAFSGSLGAVC